MYKGQTVEFNFPDHFPAGSKGEGNKQSSKLDMRFCDDEDAADIECLLRVCDACEYNPASEYHFRAASTSESNSVVKVSQDDIVADCDKANVRWIVMETPVPEEAVVGAARMTFKPAGGVGSDIDDTKAGKAVVCVDVCIYYPDSDSRSVRSQMLAQLERIAVGHGAEVIIMECMQHRVDVQDWLESCGYQELGGRICEESGLIKPTMVFEFHKNLRTSRAQTVALTTASATVAATSTSTSTSTSTTTAAVHDDDDDDDADAEAGGKDDAFDFSSLSSLSLADVEVVNGPGPFATATSATTSAAAATGGAGGDPMRGLMDNLFAALHKEQNHA